MFSVRFWLEVGKNMQEYVHFIFFKIVLQMFPVFSPGQDQLLGRAGQKNISPGISPESALYMTFGSQGWTALFDLVDTLGPKV